MKHEFAAIARNWSRRVLSSSLVIHASDTGRNRGFIRRWGLLRSSRALRSRCSKTILLMIMMLFTVTIVTLLAGRNIDTIETQQEFVVVQDMRTTKAQPNASTTHNHNISSNFFEKYRHKYSENTTEFLHHLKGVIQQDWKLDAKKNREFRTFFEKYHHKYSKNPTEFLHHLKGIKQQNWKPNAKKNREFRVDVRSELGHAGSVDVFSLTKSIAPVGKLMRFCVGGHSRSISQTLWNYLPEDAPFTSSGQFKSCSVVGSSGVLTGSGCGQQIDQSQYVLRFNIAPVKGFEADVGSKTNFTTLNPSYVKYKMKWVKERSRPFAIRMNGLKKNAHRLRFAAVLKQFKGSKLWLPAFGVSRYYKIVELAAGTAVKSKVVQPLLGNPEHFLSVAKLWRKMAKSKRVWPTTGLYIILTLIDVCDQLDLFGFWPYRTSIDGRNVPYHYHNSITGKTSVHSFDKEFKTLVNLHEQGIIKMHFGSCL